MPSLTTVLTELPIDQIEAVLNDPSSLGKESALLQNIITIAFPGIDGALVNILITFFVSWVYASGGGTISADPDPEVDAQTSTNHPRVR